VATLAAQFFLVWMFNRVSWFYNYSASLGPAHLSAICSNILITGPSFTLEPPI
jgi:branched-chain amino acid transport system permease protein